MSEQQLEASGAEPSDPLPTPDPGFPNSGRTEMRASQPPPEVKFFTEPGEIARADQD